MISGLWTRIFEEYSASELMNTNWTKPYYIHNGMRNKLLIVKKSICFHRNSLAYVVQYRFTHVHSLQRYVVMLWTINFCVQSRWIIDVKTKITEILCTCERCSSHDLLFYFWKSILIFELFLGLTLFLFIFLWKVLTSNCCISHWNHTLMASK